MRCVGSLILTSWRCYAGRVLYELSSPPAFQYKATLIKGLLGVDKLLTFQYAATKSVVFIPGPVALSDRTCRPEQTTVSHNTGTEQGLKYISVREEPARRDVKSFILRKRNESVLVWAPVFLATVHVYPKRRRSLCFI